MIAREKGRVNLKALKDYFKANPDYSSARTLAHATGQHRNSVHVHCRNLIRLGYLEENVFWVSYQNTKNGRYVIHYRLKQLTSVGQLLSKSTLTQNVTVKSCHRC